MADKTWLVSEEATKEELANMNPETHEVVLVKGYIEDDKAKDKPKYKYARDIRVIIPLTEDKLDRVALQKEVKTLKDSIDWKTHRVDVVDVNGVPTPTVVERSTEEKNNLKKIQEPVEATQEEIDAMDEETQILITTRAGFADGTIRNIKQIIPKPLEAIE